MRGRLRSVLYFVGGEAWRVRCSSRFRGVGASDTGESSLASATRARRKDSGRQEGRGRDPHTESLRRAVQFSTRKHSAVMPVSRRTPAQEQQPSTQTARADVPSMPGPRHHPFAPTHPRQEICFAASNIALFSPRGALPRTLRRSRILGNAASRRNPPAVPETHRKEVLLCPP
jgi:hypothetical protein